MKRTNSISKKVMGVISILAVVIASFSTFTIRAQSGGESNVDDFAIFPESGEKTCYTQATLSCGFNLGEQSLCLFNAYYGKPYSCTEFSCYGSRTLHTCHRVYY